MKRLIRGVLILAVLAAVAFGGFALWKKLDQAEASEDESGRVAAAEVRDIESNLMLTGEVTPAFQFEVKSEVGGKVLKIHVEVGDFVKKGGLLMTIDDTDLLTEKAAAETEIQGAQLTVNKNRGNYERASLLHQQKLISKEIFANLEADLAISENTLEKAKSRLQIVRDRLSKTQITAPADGTVLDMPVTEGLVVVAAASVNSGTVLMTFANLSKLLINSHVNQVDAPRLREGQAVEVKMSDTGDEPIKAHIDFIAPLAVVKNNIKGFEVKAEIDDNDGRLKPGMSVSMNVPVARADQAVTVPVSAVFKVRDKNVVYVRSGVSTERREVKLGVNDLYFVEITSGLAAGEMIYLTEPKELPGKS